MKKLILILIFSLSKLIFGQLSASAPFEFSQKEKLSTDAFTVFKTNKYLDFKGKDTLIQIIDNTIYERIDLNNYFKAKKNWEAIENENYDNYKKADEKYKYTYQDNKMIENYSQLGSYGVKREFTTEYNSQGFILSQQEKKFVNDSYNETLTTVNSYDNKNRVTKITKRTERKNPKENTEEIITVAYEDNFIKVTSSNGNIVCKFTKDENSVGFISKLSPRETASNFMYTMAQRRFDLAKDYYTEKMVKIIEVYSNADNQIEEVRFQGGTEKISENRVTINDIWEIRYSIIKKSEFKVNFVIVKQKNGWKIDEFKIE